MYLTYYGEQVNPLNAEEQRQEVEIQLLTEEKAAQSKPSADDDHWPIAS